jgi:hypothetical protein
MVTNTELDQFRLSQKEAGELGVDVPSSPDYFEDYSAIDKEIERENDRIALLEDERNAAGGVYESDDPIEYQKMKDLEEEDD